MENDLNIKKIITELKIIINYLAMKSSESARVRGIELLDKILDKELNHDDPL